MSGIFLGIGLEFVDTIFQTIKNSDFSQYTIAGMKTLAILFFLINILKKYNEGVANNEGYTWGLTPAELAKKLCNSDFSHFFHTGIGRFRHYIGSYRKPISGHGTRTSSFTDARY